MLYVLLHTQLDKIQHYCADREFIQCKILTNDTINAETEPRAWTPTLNTKTKSQN